MMQARHKLRLTVIVALAASALGACSSHQTMPSASQRPDSVAQGAGTDIVNTALRMIGTPYRYGGNTPAGFDCSGLVHYAYRAAGIPVPRTTEDQHDSARGISLRQARAGDLLFFRIESKPDHVAIFIGDDRFVHAPSSGKQVSVGMLSDPYWSDHFVGARRLYDP